MCGIRLIRTLSRDVPSGMFRFRYGALGRASGPTRSAAARGYPRPRLVPRTRAQNGERPGVYGGLLDKIPFGAAMNKGLTFRMGQTHVNRWTDDLLRRIQDGQIDPSFVITHTVSLEDGPAMYKTFRNKEDGCIKVVIKP